MQLALSRQESRHQREILIDVLVGDLGKPL